MLFQNKKKQINPLEQDAFSKAKGLLAQDKMIMQPAAAAPPAVNPQAQLQKTGAPAPNTIGRQDPLLERAKQLVTPNVQLQAEAPSSDADRINRMRQAIRDGGQVPGSGQAPVAPTGPRVGSTPFSATVNQQPSAPESDADRINRMRQTIRETGQLPGSGQAPVAPTGPRVGKTPFSATVNQSDLTTIAGGNPPPETQDQMIERLVRDLIKNDPAQSDAARQAMSTTLDQKSAENIAAARARMGVAGAGLTGAAGSIEGATQRADARQKAITLDEQDRALREEALKRQLAGAGLINQERAQDRADKEVNFNQEEAVRNREKEDLAFKTAIAMYEKELGVDINGDGQVGSKEIEQKQKEEEQKKQSEAAAVSTSDANARNMMRSLYPAGDNSRETEIELDKQLVKAREAYNQFKISNPNVSFDEYVKRHVDYWTGPGGLALRGLTAGLAGPQNWPTS